MPRKFRKLLTVLLCTALTITQLPTMVLADSSTPEKQAQTVTFNIPDLMQGYEMTYGDAPCNAVATSTGDGTISYTSSDENVAVIDENGNITTVSAGDTTITAAAAETDTWEKGSTSFALTINPREVSIIGITAEDREYDPNDFSVKLDFSDASIEGKIDGDDLTIDSINATGRIDCKMWARLALSSRAYRWEVRKKILTGSE